MSHEKREEGAPCAKSGSRARPRAQSTTKTTKRTMVNNNNIWTASARRRRRILNRYGRGPKKKPPDRINDAKEHHVHTTKRYNHHFSRKRHCVTRIINKYSAIRQITTNPLCRNRLTALFLAGSRRPFRRISKSYRPSPPSPPPNHVLPFSVTYKITLPELVKRLLHFLLPN